MEDSDLSEGEDQEKLLKNSIQEYTNQLAFVTSALESEPNNEDLALLKSNLEEVLNLTNESLISLKKKKLLDSLKELESSENIVENEASTSNKHPGEEANLDDELIRFQTELGKEIADAEQSEKDDKEISSFLLQLEGKKCRAPFIEEWGQLAYHNAIVLSVIEKDIELMDEIEVKVLFCNPLYQSMKPCTFYLDGHCRFSSEQCRFSHGYVVKLSDLQDFKDPDYSLLQRDAYCLAKFKDDLWYEAIVEDVLDDHQYCVKYVTFKETVVRSIEDLVPLDLENESSSDDSEPEDCDPKSETEEDELQIRILASEKLVNGPLGDWEKHTKGFGSKLMVQMGYIMGQGLGRNGEGITEPIEATILPQGKSLDRCMEIKEMKAMGCDPQKAIAKKRVKKELQEKKIADRYHQVDKKNVFDFINSKLKRCEKSEKKEKEEEGIKKSSSKNLNLKMLHVSEDLRKAQKEMSRLKQSLQRNKDRDRKMQSQIENKIINQEKLIQNLQSQEKIIHLEQNSRKNQKKLTVF